MPSAQGTPTPPDAKRGLNPLWLGIGGLAALLAALIVVVLVSGGEDRDDRAKDSGAPKEEETFDVHGNMRLITASLFNWQGQCAGEDGYDDLAGGAQVIIRDAGGEILATGALEEGVPEDKGMINVTCDFAFHVLEVPATSSTYTVEVTHRGQIAFTEEEAAALSLSLS